MSLIIDGTNGVTFNDSSLQGAAASPFGLKNRIINGDMRIDQRNAGASTLIDNITKYTLDRWVGISSTNSKFTVQRNAGSVTPPAGFTNYLGTTVTTAYTITSTGDYFNLVQYIEGFNIADLGWGTASAKTVTISFWVRGSITGTYSFALRNDASNRSYVSTYTISAANTWEYKTITISGDTSGTWLTDNGRGIEFNFDLGRSPSYETSTSNAWISGPVRLAGTVKLIETLNATLYITGVQLEVGSTATPFERRMYGTELALCQRYALMIKNGTTSIDRFGLGSTVSSTTVQLLIQHPVAFRAAPTLTTTGTASDYSVYSTAVTTCNAAPTLGEGSQFNSRYNFVTAGGLTGGQVAQCQGANTNAYLLLSAEL